MVRIEDIQSLTEFQRNARVHIKRLKRTGRPEILTVNGQAEIVVQDAKSYQRLLERAQEAEESERLRRSIADYRAGRFRDADEVLVRLEEKHLAARRPAAKRRTG